MPPNPTAEDMVEVRRAAQRAMATLGPPEAAFSATYDAKRHRVALDITPAANTACVSIHRDVYGYCMPVEGLSFAEVPAPITLYDHTAPRDQLLEYSAMFYHQDNDGVLFLDFIRLATVTAVP
jgi:hypothetical protein